MIDPGIPDVYEVGYYVQDRLGSVRLVVRAIEEPGGVVVRAFNSTTYTPYGQFYEGQRVENIDNPFKFTGQWHDEEIGQYYLRARQYDPTMMRFTSRDPIVGDRQEPLTLHKYLYTSNDPLNRIDLTGKCFWQVFGALAAGTAVRGAATLATAWGIDRGNDTLFNIGLQMHNLIAPAMYFGALAGPLLPLIPGVLQKGAVALWDATITATGVTYLAADAAARGLSYWVMTHLTTYEIVSLMDVMAQYGSPGSIPITPAGFVAWLDSNYNEE